MTRDTTVGNDFEQMVRVALERSARANSFSVEHQKLIGIKPGGGKHRVDWELIDQGDPNIRGLVSCKYQGKSGSAEEKVAYEVIKLLDAMAKDARYRRSWIAIGGQGWSAGILAFIYEDLPKWVPAMSGRVVPILGADKLLNFEFRLAP